MVKRVTIIKTRVNEGSDDSSGSAKVKDESEVPSGGSGWNGLCRREVK